MAPPALHRDASAISTTATAGVCSNRSSCQLPAGEDVQRPPTDTQARAARVYQGVEAAATRISCSSSDRTASKPTASSLLGSSAPQGTFGEGGSNCCASSSIDSGAASMAADGPSLPPQPPDDVAAPMTEVLISSPGSAGAHGIDGPLLQVPSSHTSPSTDQLQWMSQRPSTSRGGGNALGEGTDAGRSPPSFLLPFAQASCKAAQGDQPTLPQQQCAMKTQSLATKHSAADGGEGEGELPTHLCRAGREGYAGTGATAGAVGALGCAVNSDEDVRLLLCEEPALPTSSGGSESLAGGGGGSQTTLGGLGADGGPGEASEMGGARVSSGGSGSGDIGLRQRPAGDEPMVDGEVEEDSGNHSEEEDMSSDGGMGHEIVGGAMGAVQQDGAVFAFKPFRRATYCRNCTAPMDHRHSPFDDGAPSCSNQQDAACAAAPLVAGDNVVLGGLPCDAPPLDGVQAVANVTRGAAAAGAGGAIGSGGHWCSSCGHCQANDERLVGAARNGTDSGGSSSNSGGGSDGLPGRLEGLDCGVASGRGQDEGAAAASAACAAQRVVAGPWAARPGLPVALVWDERMELHEEAVPEREGDGGGPHPERPDRIRAVMARLQVAVPCTWDSDGSGAVRWTGDALPSCSGRQHLWLASAPRSAVSRK
jgi:hypothetical protein